MPGKPHHPVIVQPMGSKSTLKSYVLSTRPWSIPCSVLPITAVLLYLHFTHGVALTSSQAIGAVMAGLAMHLGANLTNTLYDHIKGTDKEATAADRTLVDGELTEDEVQFLSLVCYGSALAIVYYSHPENLFVAYMLTLVGICSGFLYTADPGSLKYYALGDVAIFLSFGPGLAAFTCALCNVYDLEILFFVIPMALPVVAILHANNARDIEADTKAGAKTVANILGFQRSYTYFWILLAGVFASVLVLAVRQLNIVFLLPWMTLPMVKNLLSRFNEKEIKGLVEKTAIFQTAFGILYLGSLCLWGMQKS